MFERSGFKNSKFNKECKCSLGRLPPRNLAVFEGQFLLEITAKEPKVSPITKFHKLFKLL